MALRKSAADRRGKERLRLLRQKTEPTDNNKTSTLVAFPGIFMTHHHNHVDSLKLDGSLRQERIVK